MMPYEQHLNRIANEITIKDADRPIYTKDFDIIRKHIFTTLCQEDDVFSKIYKGTSLFGSYANNVRIRCPEEFDVIFELSLPYSSKIIVEDDPDRPGFVRLEFNKVMNSLQLDNGHRDVYNKFKKFIGHIGRGSYLKYSDLQEWLNKLFLCTNKNKVCGHRGDVYVLEYSDRALARTIFAHCDARRISMDFVPAICFPETEWMQPRREGVFACEEWYAIPKPSKDGPNYTKEYAFGIFNPKAEHDLLLNKQNLKVVYRLLKALRDQHQMKRFKSYFLTAAFLWEIEKQESDFWNKPLHIILEHMLVVLYSYFQKRWLPFFWNRDVNLLSIWRADESVRYANELHDIYNTLKTYKDQSDLSESTVRKYFKITK